MWEMSAPHYVHIALYNNKKWKRNRVIMNGYGRLPHIDDDSDGPHIQGAVIAEAFKHFGGCQGEINNSGLIK